MLRLFFLCFALLPALVAAATPETPVQAEVPDAAAALEEGVYGEALGGYLRGQTAVLRGDAAMALSGFLAALGADSANIGLQQDAFASSLLTGNVDTAVRLARVLPAASESQTMVWLVNLAAAAHAGDADTVLAMAGRLQRAVPDLLQFKLLQAYAEVARGVAVESVIRQMGPVEGISPQMARQLYHMGRMRAQVGDVKGALALVEQAYALEPTSLFTTTLLASLYNATGKQALATEVQQRFALANPQMALLGIDGAKVTPNVLANATLADDVGEVLFDFGVLVWAQGAELTARQIFNLALWLTPEANYILYYSAMIEESAGNYPTAAVRYQKLLADPEVGDAARLRLAELSFKQGDTAGAARQADVLLQAHPKDIGALRARAEMAFEAQDFARAAREYQKIMTLMPKETDADTLAGLWFALGAAQERMGKIKLAGESLQRSLGYAPANPAVLNYLGYMWVEHGVQVEEAFVLLNSALMLAPQDGAVMDSVGWAYFLRGETDKALVFLEQAVEMVPDDAVVVDHLGDAYLKQGWTLQAVWQWQRAVVLAEANLGEYGKVKREAMKKIRRFRD